jgi:hypothetical protein
MCSHRFREALASFEEGGVLMRDRCGGDPWAVGGLNIFSLNTLLFLGEFREAAKRAPRVVADVVDRGDLYAATLIRTAALPWVHLIAGKADDAWRESEEAIKAWSQSGFHLQHAYDACMRSQIRLYEGRCEEAFAIADAGIARMRRALLLRSQHMRLHAIYIRGRCATAAALASKGAARAHFAARAMKDARRLRRERCAYGDGCAFVVDGGIASALGEDRSREAASFAAAVACFASVAMDGYAWPARWRHAKLIGDEARAREAEEAFAAQGVTDVTRWVAMFAPGSD